MEKQKENEKNEEKEEKKDKITIKSDNDKESDSESKFNPDKIIFNSYGDDILKISAIGYECEVSFSKLKKNIKF